MIIILLAAQKWIFYGVAAEHFISFLFSSPSRSRRLAISHARLQKPRTQASAISSELLVKIIDYKVTRQAASYSNKYYKLSRYLRINSLIICFHILPRSSGCRQGWRSINMHASNCCTASSALLILYLN